MHQQLALEAGLHTCGRKRLIELHRGALLAAVGVGVPREGISRGAEMRDTGRTPGIGTAKGTKDGEEATFPQNENL